MLAARVDVLRTPETDSDVADSNCWATFAIAIRDTARAGCRRSMRCSSSLRPEPVDALATLVNDC
jgi:hypothetical protein